MPRYVALLYGDENRLADASPEEIQGLMAAHDAFSKPAREAGVMEGGEALENTTTATTVRAREGKVSTTDGPFAETKEQLGGFYLLTCKDLDEAIEWASKIPEATSGSVEVRPVVEFPDA